MSDDVTYLSPSRLATYAKCPRAFDYEYVQEVESPDETRLWLNQGLAYHEAIEVVCEETGPADDPEVIHDRALAAFDAKWDEHLEPGEYASRAHQEYQYTENRAAVAAFFDPEDGDGIEHAQQSVATELWVECVRDGIGLHGKADNVLQTDDGLHVIDYKRNTDGILSSRTADCLVDHLNGEDCDPGRVKNAFQTACYVEGVKQSHLYEPGMEVRFSFYGLLNKTSFDRGPDGYAVSARGWPREVTDVYDEHAETIWELIERAHEGIRTERHEPEPFPLISEEVCPDCTYQEMCGEYLAEEVRR